MSPVTLILPIKSGLDAAELNTILELTASQAVDGADAVGTVHFARWVTLREHNQIAFFAAFDGSLRQYVEGVAMHLGPLVDALYKHVVNAPPLPVGKNVEGFYQWASANNLEVSGFYSAYPNLSVQDIRFAAGISHGASNTETVSSLTVIMPSKSQAHLAAASQLITQTWARFCDAADEIGTLHFARFLPLGTTMLTYVSEYDGAFATHIQDLLAHMGPLFDQILEDLVDPPPAPVKQNAAQFARWISDHNMKPLWFYSAYPNLSVRDIRARPAKVVQTGEKERVALP